LKIALITPPLLKTPPTAYGGLERVVYDLGVELVKMGHKVVLYAAAGSRLEGGFVYETMKELGTVNVDWVKVEKDCYDIYKNHLPDYDIIHDHTWWSFVYIAKAENLSIKVCHTHHGHLHPNWLKPIPSVKPFKMNMIAISGFMATIYSRAMNRHVHFIYNGIDTSMYQFSRDHGDRLLYVGRFAPYKGAHIALEVAKRVGLPLDLVGGSFVEDPGYIEKIRAQCDGEKYRIFVDATHEVKIDLMRKAKAFLFPSQMGEPFGLVGVEANACGTPVVALRDGAIPELFLDGVNGYVCDNVDQMVDAVRKVDSIDPGNCKKIVEDNFSRKVMATRYAKKYEEIVAGQEW